MIMTEDGLSPLDGSVIAATATSHIISSHHHFIPNALLSIPRVLIVSAVDLLEDGARELLCRPARFVG